ncbi:hypothetical protein HBH70_026480 [Parastagonospora nodorum]|nr:hypothetical protein HBH70_026480 [Parastagonospora nodorum]KAH5443480.1 hypothetical protein HBI30_226700 [Parastagonospora nodorum]KAH6448218.1 hypothetical protein HBI57_201510 [Parastagonospora nodorum]KAH6457278.1 hypothetical protein HBI58_196220 [Parastagonospora nodorum]KAH6536762.1 hypothetical protein HBI81_065400 [Parastagonospora nodorum]
MASKTMRAVRFHGPSSDGRITIDDIPIPRPGPTQLLVKIRSAGLCHSDMEVVEGRQALTCGGESWTMTPCHEACGTVVEIGNRVTHFEVSDDVGFLPYLNACGDCEACSVTSIACPKTTIQGFNHDGFMAEYSLVEAGQAVKLPEKMDPTTAAPLFCAGLTSFHAVDKAELSPGQWIAVVGVGGLGHLAVQYAVAMGLRVVALDIGSGQRNLAKALGAHEVFDPTDPGFATAVKNTTGGGAHAAVIMSGNVLAYKSGLQTLRIGGKLMVVGVTDPNFLPLTAVPVSCGFVQVRGASSGRADEMEKCLKFSHKHNIRPKVAEFSIEQFPEMLDMMKSGRIPAGRMIVNSFA